MSTASCRSRSNKLSSLALRWGFIGIGLLAFARRGLADDAPPSAAASARMVGGHIGAAVPLVSFHSVGKGARSISDQVTIAVPIGITVHLDPNWVFDFETVFANDVHPWGGTGFTVDPGVVYVGGPVALGLRLKFDASPNANVGLIPLVHKGIADIGGATWFIEGAFPLTAQRGGGTSLGVVAHTGVAF